MKLWLQRHAAPLVAPGTCYGATDLDARPADTQAAAAAIARLLPQSVPVWASPLRRCQQLKSALLRLRPDLPAADHAGLREMDFGCWEMWPWDAIPRTAMEAWVADFADHPFGGRDSVSVLMARVAATLEATRAAGSAEAVWITHAGVIRAANLLASGITRVRQPADWPLAAPAFGAWQQLDI